jgi:hypothetical protein
MNSLSITTSLIWDVYIVVDFAIINFPEEIIFDLQHFQVFESFLLEDISIYGIL